MGTKYLIVGLGNPADKLRITRHNVGFLMIDYLTQTLKLSQPTYNFKSYIWVYQTADIKIYLIKAQTYMNLTGHAVRSIKDYFKITNNHTIVIQDDKDMQFGKLRLRAKGSSGGHRGIQNIIDQIESNEFIRIKLGVGNGNHLIPTEKWVLSNFTKAEMEILRAKAAIVKDVVLALTVNGSTFNQVQIKFSLNQ